MTNLTDLTDLNNIKSNKPNGIMKKANMLCLGPKKNLSSPRVELTAQGVTQHTDVQSQV